MRLRSRDRASGRGRANRGSRTSPSTTTRGSSSAHQDPETALPATARYERASLHRVRPPDRIGHRRHLVAGRRLPRRVCPLLAEADLAPALGARAGPASTAPCCQQADPRAIGFPPPSHGPGGPSHRPSALGTVRGLEHEDLDAQIRVRLIPLKNPTTTRPVIRSIAPTNSSRMTCWSSSRAEQTLLSSGVVESGRCSHSAPGYAAIRDVGTRSRTRQRGRLVGLASPL